MSAILLWTANGANKSLSFDLVTTEYMEATTHVTDNPVEKGLPVTDHVRPEPDRVKLEVFCTNHPIDGQARGGRVTATSLDVPKYNPPFSLTPGAVFSAVGSAISALGDAIFGGPPEWNATVLTFGSNFDAPAELEEALRTLRDSAQILTVSTTTRDYENMILESFTRNKTADTGLGAEFTLDFKQIRTVDVKVVDAPIPTETRGKKSKSQGQKDGKDAKNPTKKKSLLKSLF